MIRTNDSKVKTTLKAAVLLTLFLLFAAAPGFCQQVINLTAGPDTTTLPDGTVIPMWGYTCGTPAGGTTTATCAPLSGSGSGGSLPAVVGGLGGVYVLNGGSGYSSTPGVAINANQAVAPTTTAVANAIVSNGVIVGFNLTNPGAGYTAAPTIVITDSTGSGATAAAGPAWSPVLITVPYTTSTLGASTTALQINLTNNLSFALPIATSIQIVGQVGGGLGTPSSFTPSPSHTDAQGCVSWFIATSLPGQPCMTTTPLASPPVQGQRVQSMAMEVAAGAPGTATALTWNTLKPGTYLIESATHPSIQVPMGLIGMLVVTTAPSGSGTTAGTAYPAVTGTNGTITTAQLPAVQYNAEVPLEFSEIDPVQNKAVDLAVRTSGFSETAVWSAMNNVDGSGGKGCGQTHTCYPPAVNYTPFYYLINGLAFDKTHAGYSLFPATAGVTSTTVTVGGVTTTTTTPATTGIPATGTVLLRMVNAGLRMHVPSTVGSLTTGFPGIAGTTNPSQGNPGPVQGFTLIAEDGNPVPDLAITTTTGGATPTTTTTAAPRVQTDVFMAAGKTFDVMVNVPAGATPPSIPVYDRELSLSANSSIRDAGMLAYVGVNGAALPVSTGSGVFAAAKANPDTYDSIAACATAPCVPLVVSDPSKGVIANDINVNGVALAIAPTSGTLTCNVLPGSPAAGICANGTFTYTPNPGVFTANATTGVVSGTDAFTYCANGAGAPNSTLCTTVTLGASSLSGTLSAINQNYTSKMATYIKIPPPGLLFGNTDPNNLPLTVALSSTSLVACTDPVTVQCGTVDKNGGFILAIPVPTTPATAPTSATFSYNVQNSQGVQSTNSASVTVTFPAPSGLKVNVLDAQAFNNCHGDAGCIALLTPFSDYKWIIEEDKTFWIDPNCTTNQSVTVAGCPAVVDPSAPGQSTIPTFGVQFHTSNMDYVAQGCTGPLSCEAGQTMLDTNPSSTTYLQHIAAVCDVGAGACRPDPTKNGYTPVNPSQVSLDPSKRYYISVLPGDAANPFPANLTTPQCNGLEALAGDSTCGHTMTGAPIPPACNILGGPNGCNATSAFTQPVNVLALPTPLPTGKLSAIVFEDDYPLNGEQDSGGGGATVAPIEPGLGGFNLVLWDTYGGLGDFTGQDTFDAFNQPLSNSLSGTIDPITGLDACPVSANATSVPSTLPPGTVPPPGTPPTGGVTGMIVTCPKYEADGKTLSPLAGQAVIDHLMPDKFSVQAYPGADRIARGEQWVQTNTLDGQHPHDSFIRIGEPSYFQEYGPAGYHVAIGFANPAIINARHDNVCGGLGTPGAVGGCANTIDGQVDVERLSRTPDQRLYASGSRDALTWTQCWVSLGDPDGEDFMFTFCDANGNFRFTGVPGGNWRLTIGDQWNDQIIDGLSTPANVGCLSETATGGGCPAGTVTTLHMGNIGVQQWQSDLYTKTCIDDNKNGICDPGEIGIPFIYTMIHYRDGHNANALTTDFNGVANFNETFPLFNWYVVEADSTRYKTTGIHTVYDAGGPADGSPSCGTTTNGARQCGKSTAYNFLANTYEALPLPTDLSVPGAVYCATADCTTEASSFAAGTAIPSLSTPAAGTSTGRIDPPWVWAEGWSGMTSQGNYIEFAKAPYAACNPAQAVSTTNFCTTVTYTPAGGTPTTTQVGENGGIYGQVAYASTRPFDDASQMIQQPWEPNIPNVTVNLYQEGFAADGVTPTLTLVDTTQTTSWDDWAQGFYPNSTATPGTGQTSAQKPYLSCPGQGTAAPTSPNQDLFFFTLFDQPNYLDWYTSMHSGGTVPVHSLPYNAQYKCYDAMHIWNQVQPAPYDGKYFFPSSLGVDPTTGKPLTTHGSLTNSGTGTNCTICVPNPDTTDVYRVGNPMLPPGKYVVQVVMPPGYEVYKEEDKNLLIGDNFIAPVTQEFAGLGGDIFILPDQASVASMYDPTNGHTGYNPNNFQNETTGLGLNEELSGVPGFPGYTDPVWPCVGEMRVVPDYLSIYPQAKETAPFSGATRPICDRKEVTLTNQMAVNARFFIYTSTHIAAKYTGVITDDFTSEFDPFSPQFGEKFSPPNMPIATRDYMGNEISRVYSDHWGTYDGLTYSSWEVNPPNITGYSPTMMVQCMNDPGPILDTRAGSPTLGQMIVDPLYNPAYSDFCYENPYMPGLTTYNDTPVVPTSAFVGAGYNNPDCSYPDTTPAIKEVDGDGIGPWIANFNSKITITALGDQLVNNSTYSGPSANAPPFNQKTITRHYGFGATQGTGTVTVGGVPLTNVTWSDTTITGTVNLTDTATTTSVQPCTVPQQGQYGGLPAWCGQLVITSGNGKQSIDTVTVTIGGKTPVHVPASSTVQSFIDEAAPGDLIIVDPTCMTTGTTPTSTGCTASALNAATPTQTATTGIHNEMLLMWKPVRLQGVGAATSVIDATAFPAGKLLEPWRRHVNCLFGLTLTGVPFGSPIPTSTPGVTTPAPYDSNVPAQFSCPDSSTADTWNYFGTDLTGSGNGQDVANLPQVDRIPLEAVTGWDATVNGNLAEQLQEPSLMGAYEGAGITVLSKGIWLPAGTSPWTDGSEPGAFPLTALLLQDVPAQLPAVPQQFSHCNDLLNNVPTNPYPSNFYCNPSSIDGLTIRDSSQGGGGIFVHGWAHYLQIANNRVYNNAGTLSGGITVGQGEFPTAITISSVTNGVGQQNVLDAPPSCGSSVIVGAHLPYCLDLNVNVHHNDITSNSSLGDELFSGTLAGGGGASFCTGADYYKFDYNWVCGNISSAEGGGLVHLGYISNGDIEHNSILFNQSTNPTIPTNGGGIMVMGTPDTDPVCGTQIDADCPPGLSDGTGNLLTINANLVQGNAADSGSGGGIRLQQVSGTEVSTFPGQPALWNTVNLTNNIIVNNVAGWDGAGISLQDALNVNIVNNTIAHNDTLASSGVLTQSIGTPDASAPAGSCVQTGGPSGPQTASCPQPSGLVSVPNSSVLTTTFTNLTITCPPEHFQGGTAANGTCIKVSYPAVYNDLFYQNRSYYIGITANGGTVSSQLNQQNLIALFNAFSGTPAAAQTSTGSCPAGATYWDIGVRGDTSVSGGSGVTINRHNSMITPGNGGSNNVFVSEYCNGSRVPPECSVAAGCGGPSGYGVPPGIVDASSPNPVFTLTPAATVDEGNNWINVSWGPLAMSNESLKGGLYSNYGGGPALGNYALAQNSIAIDQIPTNDVPASVGGVPPTDFFGNPRPNQDGDARIDYGAVETQHNRITTRPTLSSINPNTGFRGTSFSVTLTGLGLTGTSAVNVSGGAGNGITVSGIEIVSDTQVLATFTITATAPLTGRMVSVTTPNGTSTSVPFAVTVPTPALTSITPNQGARGAAVSVTLQGNNLSGVTINPLTGITIGGVTTTATSVTATFTIRNTAPTGSQNVTVSNGAVTSNSVPFTVLGPTLTSISPNTGVRGTASLLVTFTGTNLTGTTGISGLTGGVSLVPGSLHVVSATQVTANLAISTTASVTTPRNLGLTSPGGNVTNTVPFTVQGATLATILPTSGSRSTSVSVTITGTNLSGTTSLIGLGSGVTASGITNPDGNTIKATLTITSGATLGNRTIGARTTAGTTTNTVTFAVTN